MFLTGLNRLKSGKKGGLCGNSRTKGYFVKPKNWPFAKLMLFLLVNRRDSGRGVPAGSAPLWQVDCELPCDERIVRETRLKKQSERC